MNAKSLSELLNGLHACALALDWSHGKTLSEAWSTCERGDWMLWLVGNMAGKKGWPTRQEVVLAACACAETALKYVPAGEDRPRIAIETARKWSRGEATIQEVRQAADSAYAAAAAASSAYASAYAYAAAYASAASAAYAAYAAADAAYASADAARNKALSECANIVRSLIPEIKL